MARVTVDMYSGRVNPTIEVTGDDEDQLLQALTQTSVGDFVSRVAEASVLGFRGLFVDKNDGSNSRFAEVQSDDPQLFVPASAVTDSLKNAILSGIRAIEDGAAEVLGDVVSYLTGSGSSAGSTAGGGASTSSCATAPPYDPANWNSDPAVRLNNNCCNYACATPTGTFAQTGRGTGQIYASISCPEVSGGATRDGLVSMPDAITCLEEGYLVALVVATDPDFTDFHWYRLGDDMLWTHKPGSTPATNVDNSGNPITDPRTADRGRYSQFCGFFCVKTGSITIN